MRTLNRILQAIVMLIFSSLIVIGIVLTIIVIVGGPGSSVGGLVADLGITITLFVVAFVCLLFLFALVIPLLEIAENTRVLRDAVQSGSLRVVIVSNKEKPIEPKIHGNDLTLGEGLRPIKGWDVLHC